MAQMQCQNQSYLEEKDALIQCLRKDLLDVTEAKFEVQNTLPSDGFEARMGALNKRFGELMGLQKLTERQIEDKDQKIVEQRDIIARLENVIDINKAKAKTDKENL